MKAKSSRRNLAAGLLAFLLLVALALLQHQSTVRSPMQFNATDQSDGFKHWYSSKFPHTENPIYEGGKWKVSGEDFAEVRTLPGLSYGAQTGTRVAPDKYDDSTAVLTGNWGPDQIVQVMVHYSGARTDQDYDEVEIRLRSAISGKSNTGYEINCRVGRPGIWGYIQVGKVNGALGDFTGPFDQKTGAEYSCHDGDIIVGTAVGTTLKAYINGEQVLEARDSTFPTGAPGIGFYHEGTQAQNTDFGISSVVASDNVPATWKGLSPLQSHIQHWTRYLNARVMGKVYRYIY